MSGYDPSELMAVCEAILQDGELSGREVYRLSQWLNEHREATQHWPGNLLVKPLQAAWADGKLSVSELQEIGRLLMRAHDEWVKRRAGDTLERSPEVGAAALGTINLGQPRLPTIAWSTRVRSEADPEKKFDVDLRGPTCTCEEWRDSRQNKPEGDLGRCCSHVLEGFCRVEPVSGWPGWLGAFLRYRWKPDPRKVWMVMRIGESFVLASTAPMDWADVFAPATGEYERFGYHLLEDRWAYQSAPESSDSVRARIIVATKAAAGMHGVERVRIRLPEVPARAQG